MPLAIEVLAAEIVIDCNAAAVTVRTTVLEVIPFWVAVMLLVPTPAPVASPLVLMPAAVVLEEVQVTELVRFCVLLSLKVPTAVN